MPIGPGRVNAQLGVLATPPVDPHDDLMHVFVDLGNDADHEEAESSAVAVPSRSALRGT
jgi:hypothetical protein